MAKEIIIYDTVRNHLDQDYQGSDLLPMSIAKTFGKLIEFLNNQSNDDTVVKLVTPAGLTACDAMNSNSPIDCKLDSSMFTDEGNKLMNDCYGRWVASITFDRVGPGNSDMDGDDDLAIKFRGIKPTPLTFGGFREKIEAMKGNPAYINGEVNKEDTYKDVKDIPVTENFLNILNSIKVVNESEETKSISTNSHSFLDMLNKF